MSRRLVIAVLALCTAVVPITSAFAGASNPDQACPFPGGADPDFVRFLGPSTIPGDGQNHAVTLFASESEAARNQVTLIAIATGVDAAGNPLTDPPVIAIGSASHDTTVQVSLTGVPGAIYTIQWAVVFDYAVHPCASVQPGFSSYTVVVGGNSV